MTICYFGDYNPNYARTRIILKGLEKLGVRVIHCNVYERGWRMYWKLWRLHAAMKEPYDIMIVGFGDSRFMPELARLVSRAPIIWEALFSQYDNWVFDRKLVGPHSPKAYLYWFLDWLGCKVTDMLLIDTHQSTVYFAETFGVPRSKLAYAYVGADTTIFYPRERTKRSDKFEVEFHGLYFPMQGADVIVRAAKLLEHDDVHFTMIGKGQEVKRVRLLADELHVTNVTFYGYLPPQEIVEYVANADVCMGLVGDIPRAFRTLPTKVWETAAMEKAAINVDSPAIREVFTPGIDVIGVKAGSPEALAQAILDLKKSGKAEEMGKAAGRTFLKNGTPESIAGQVLAAIYERFPQLAR